MDFYSPLNTLKQIDENIWLVDGPEITFFGMPFSTRMTVIRLRNGDVFLHSPIKPDPDLLTAVNAVGPVKHLVSPNWIHYAFIDEWSGLYPDAIKWASPNVQARARKKGRPVIFDRNLGVGSPPEWASEIDQMIVEGSRVHREVVFFHVASKTLILTDLIENFELKALPLLLRPIVWMAGVFDPDGKMPVDMWFTFRKRKNELRSYVERMIAWCPDHVVLAHGRCYNKDCEKELRRAFRKCL